MNTIGTSTANEYYPVFVLNSKRYMIKQDLYIYQKPALGILLEKLDKIKDAITYLKTEQNQLKSFHFLIHGIDHRIYCMSDYIVDINNILLLVLCTNEKKQLRLYVSNNLKLFKYLYPRIKSKYINTFKDVVYLDHGLIETLVFNNDLKLNFSTIEEMNNHLKEKSFIKECRILKT